MMKVPNVSVIIPSLDGYRDGNVPRLIGQLENQTFRDLEIIVIKGVRPNGKARNAGAKKAKGAILISIDDDVTIGHAKVIENLVRQLEHDDTIGLLGISKLIPKDSNWKIKKSDFIYDEEKDCFVCPAGYTLNLKRESNDGKKIYQAVKTDCDVCPYYKARCCSSTKGEPRIINSDDKEPLRQKMNEKMEQESSKEIYKKRKRIVEPVFAQIKNSGFQGFSLRGYEKAIGKFSLACAVHNFKKIVKAIFGGRICLESGRLAPMAA